MPEERLQRALARAGHGSRRSSEELIAAGRVTVNGKVATIGDKVDTERDDVQVDGTHLNLDPSVRYYALHKPAGVVTTMSDPQGRPDLTGFLPEQGSRVFPVGRLDRDSEGLLLLTNDGELANRLMHPRFAVEKEYLAEVEGTPSAKQLSRLRRGVDLEDGPARAASASAVAASGDRGAVRIVMTEGRKREVRRLLAEVGLPVTRLVRLRVGPVVLGGLAPGGLRELTPDEVRALSAAGGGELPVACASSREIGSRSRHREGTSMRVRAARGAIVVNRDEADALLEATGRLLAAVLESNAVEAEDLVSILFTATDDLRSAFPAEAARRMGLGAVPLMCAREIPVDGSMARVIRVLVHFHSERRLDEVTHVSLDGAESLRDDLG